MQACHRLRRRTCSEPHPMTRLADLLQDIFKRRADALAVQGVSWLLSYRDLDRESSRVAANLRRHGVGPGHLVPMLMRRSPEFIVCMLAVVRCGAAYVPIDLANPPARQKLLLQGLACPVVLADAAAMAGASQDKARRWMDPVRLLSKTGSELFAEWIDDGPEMPLYAMFTSGSTGIPKGVLVPRRGVMRLVREADYASFTPDARWAQLSSLAFDASTLEIWGALLHGATCVVQEVAMPSLDTLGRFLREREITDAWLTAALFNALVDERAHGLAGLRQLLTGGERASPSHMRRFLQACPDVRLINGYGPTENTTFSLCHTVTLSDLDGPSGVPIGLPIHGTQAHVMGTDGLPLPDGETGELWVSGDGVALRYVDDIELTRQKFLSYRGQTTYRTGDLVRRRIDGVMEFLGRNDRQVKIQGNRIELDEVERVLSQAPGVGEVAALVRGADADARHLVVAYGGQSGLPPPPAVLRHWAEGHLPPVMVPHVLHAIEHMPINVNGKLDRRALEALIAATPALASKRPAELGGDTQRRLARLWQRHLGPLQLGSDSDFMGLGGTSLLALRLAAAVKQEFGREFDPIDVLRHPQLAAQAGLIDQARPVRTDVPPVSDDSQSVPLTRAQHALIAATALDVTGCAYLVHVAWRIGSGVAPAALRDAFVLLAQRHPILRTGVRLQGDLLSARLAPELPPGWWIDHGNCAGRCPPESDWAEEILSIVRQSPDLSTGPMRIDVWHWPDAPSLLVWTLHHFAIDEAAIALAREELSRLLSGQKLDPVYGSPFSFASLEQAWTDETAMRELAMDAARTLNGQTPPLPAPPGPGSEMVISLPDDVLRAVARLPDRWGATLFTPLLVAWGLTLQQVFGPAWRFVVTPFSRRMEPELTEPLGYLLDLRLIEAGARPDESLRETVERVHAALLTAQQPRMVPLDRIAQEVGLISPQARAGLTQFAMTWRVDAHGDFDLAGQRCQQLWLPQGAARFGLCLHAERNGAPLALRLEGVQSAFDNGLAQPLAAVLLSRLRALCELDGDAMPALTQVSMQPGSGATAPDPNDPVAAAASQQWTRCLGQPPDNSEADFLRLGGTSLLAMRLAAGLRSELGRSLDVAAFLARPTFGALRQQLHKPGPPAAASWALIGPRAFRRVVLVLPGYRGTALGMYELADELHKCLPDDHSVAMVDLRTIMRRAPEHGRVWFFVRQLQQVVRDLGEARLAGVVGFSLGGLLGAELLNSLPAAQRERVPLWMVDTYVPKVMHQGLKPRLTRALVALVRSPVATLHTMLRRPDRLGPTRTAEQDAVAGDEVPRWLSFLAELAGSPVSAPEVNAVLVRSTHSARRVGLVRRRAGNGWAAAQFKTLRVIALDAEHDDLRHSAAAQVARALVGTLRQPEA